MARTDDDSWDITEGVGATALGVALARVAGGGIGVPAVHRLATHSGSSTLPSHADGSCRRPHMVERIRAISNYAASRTKWFDDFFVAASAHGITQAVILAAGLDARAWRLPWADDSVVYEIDQPKVLAFKAGTLPRRRARGALRRRAHRPPPGLAEGPARCGIRSAGADCMGRRGLCCRICPPTVRTCCSSASTNSVPRAAESGSNRSAPGSSIPSTSRAAANSCVRCAEAAGSDDTEGPDVADLWFIENRTDVAEWLMEHGWRVTAEDAGTLMERYGRPPSATTDDATPQHRLRRGRSRG